MALVAGFGAWQAALSFGHLRGFRGGPPGIAPWMTVRQVAKAYDVPPTAVTEALGLPGGVTERRPLGVIARDEGRSFEEIRDALLEAIAESRGGVPGSGTPRPGPGPG
jgi:hypothetical protein